MSATSDSTPIFVFGAGGHGRAVSEVIRREGKHRIARVLDDDPNVADLAGLRADGGREALPGLRGQGLEAGIVAIGNVADREMIMTLARAAGLHLVAAIDPAAVIAADAVIGEGTVIMPMAFAGANARIGSGAIINTAATVDHDCVVDDYAHLSAGVHLTGGCRVGARTFVGIGAVLGRPVSLGQRVVIGAGAAVINDVPDGVVAAGVPARPLSSSP